MVARAKAWIVLAGSALVLAGCAHPLTRPPGPRCAAFMSPYQPTDLTARERALLAAGAAAPSSPLEEALAEKLRGQGVSPDFARPGAPARLDVLILSGGGSYGAYGAGFLTGLYGAGAPAGPEIALRDYDVVTGISTGAVVATYVWGAIILDGRPADPAGNRGLKDLAGLYQVTDKDLFTKQGLLPAVLGSNGLYDPRGLLERRVHDGVRAYAGLLKSGGQKVDIGAVNLTNGKFYRFDLPAMVASPAPEALDCYAEAVLASAAIPLAFPPRFIDGEPYYDGGIRFSTYYGDVLPRLAAMAARAGRKLELNIRIIVNGNQSPNEPGADAALARDCDAAGLDQVHARCPPVANSLLGSLTGGGAKGLVPRAVEDIMVDQIGIDSTHRIYADWRAADVTGTFKYTFVSNAEMASPPPDAGAPGACQRPAGSTDQFDRSFMNCLFAVGQAKGRAARWSFESVK